MALSIYSAEQTHPGKKRSINQDYVASFPPDRLEDIEASGNIHVLADGVGGASLGERASKYAALKVRSEYYKYPEIPPEERLRRIIRKVSNEIYHYSRDSIPPIRMATTIVVAVIINDELIVAHVGDSRAYLIHNGETPHQITRDHSIVGEMVRNGEMTELEAMQSRIKNRLSRAVGSEIDVAVEVTKKRIPLQPRDKILLCSDGITRYATKEQLAKLIYLGNPEDVVKHLINYANREGGADNISAIFIELGEPLPEGAPTIGVVGQLPDDVHWDSMETKPFGIYRDHTRFPLNRKMLPLAFVVISIFVAGLWISSIAFSKSKRSSSIVATNEFLYAINSTLTSEARNNITKLTQTEQNRYSSSPTETPTNSPTPTHTQTIPTSTSSPTITSTSTSTHTHTPTNQTRTSTPTSTNTQSPTPSFSPTRNNDGKEIDCELEISKNLDYTDVKQIAWYLLKIDQNVTTYFRSISCSKNNTGCDYDGRNFPHFAKNGWILVFPNVQHQFCIDAGGLPYQK